MHRVFYNQYEQTNIGITGVMCYNICFNKQFIQNKGNNKITELRTILQRESQNS